MARAAPAAAVAAMLLLAALGCAAADQKRILMLHSFGPDFKPWNEYAKSIRAELERQSPWPLDFHEHALLSARIVDEFPEGPFIAYLDALFAKRPPDLIVSIGAPAAGFVQRHRERLFATTPMVLTVVDQRRVQYSKLGAHDAVVPVSIDYHAAIANILRVLPETRQVAVVVGMSAIEKWWREEIGKQVQPFAERVSYTWYNDLSFEQILQHAAALPPRSAIFWELMIVDAAGVVHEEGKALRRLHAVASAPIFSYTDAFFGHDIVGGPHVPVGKTGEKVAEVAIRILRGEKPSDIKVEPIGFASPKYDWREMQRWGISESRLPPGSEIHFREPSVWERYLWQLVMICAAFALQAVLITWLLYEHRRRLQSETAAHALSGRLIHAQEAERSRLARELHDDVTQRLAVLAIDAGREERNLPHDAGGAALQALRQGLVQLSEDVHSLSYRLHPSILEDLGLVEALKSECERFARTYPIRLHVEAEDLSEPVPREVALSLFRIAQEALRNIARHANATRAEVSLNRLRAGLQLAVWDNGIGFDPSEHRTSLGHAGMRQRAVLVGGKLDILSRSGHGTVVLAWVPLNPAPQETTGSSPDPHPSEPVAT